MSLPSLNHICSYLLSMLCYAAAELETDVVPIVLQLAKSEMSDDFRSEAAGVSIYLIDMLTRVLFSYHNCN